MKKSLARGIYPPVPTFFTAQDELDTDLLEKHLTWLALTGIAGYVVLGSNGEAAHLSDQERAQVFAIAGKTIQHLNASRPPHDLQQPLLFIAGCGAQSTRQTLTYCHLAQEHGADYVLILPPSYYRGRMDHQALLAHYQTIADSSPLPVLIYNMPTSAAGLDLDVPLITKLAQHPNIAGLKDSSGNIVKIASIVASVTPEFGVFAGSADFLLPALTMGAIGAVAALANVVPEQVCHLQQLWEAGKLEEARVLQSRLIPANAAVTTRFGVAGLKVALEQSIGYGGLPRSPLQSLTQMEREQVWHIFSQLSQAT